MKNLGNMLKQAQQMQQRMGEMQAKLAETEMEGSSGAGLVKITINGKGEFRKVQIDPTVVSPDDVEMLEDLLVAAANDARAKVEAHLQDEMGKLTGGLNLPPGMKLPF